MAWATKAEATKAIFRCNIEGIKAKILSVKELIPFRQSKVTSGRSLLMVFDFVSENKYAENKHSISSNFYAQLLFIC